MHLRAPNGRYAGPIVVGSRKRGRRAIVGVRAGAKLGRIKVRRGYARVRRKLPKRWVVATRVARARKGVPIGAGAFGRVRSRLSRGAPSDDRDLDGIPDKLDIDDDGDLILDGVERSASRRPRAADTFPVFGAGARLEVGLDGTANANPRHATDPGRPAFDDAQISAALAASGVLRSTSRTRPFLPTPNSIAARHSSAAIRPSEDSSTAPSAVPGSSLTAGPSPRAATPDPVIHRRATGSERLPQPPATRSGAQE